MEGYQQSYTVDIIVETIHVNKNTSIIEAININNKHLYGYISCKKKKFPVSHANIGSSIYLSIVCVLLLQLLHVRTSNTL